jgi:hypothetical protein
VCSEIYILLKSKICFIGCADFIPVYTGGEDKAFEGLTSVFNKASAWVSQQGGIRVTNVESPWCKVKSGESGKPGLRWPLGHTNLFSWIAGGRAHFPRLGGRKKTVTSCRYFRTTGRKPRLQMYLYFRRNLKAHGGIILQLEVNKII